MSDDKKLQKIQDEVDKSEPLMIARQIFPIEVIIKEGSIYLSIDLSDEEFGIKKSIDLKLFEDGFFCFVEALFALASLWSWRQVYKRKLLFRK
jgi:hypothetical protein